MTGDGGVHLMLHRLRSRELIHRAGAYRLVRPARRGVRADGRGLRPRRPRRRRGEWFRSFPWREAVWPLAGRRVRQGR